MLPTQISVSICFLVFILSPCAAFLPNVLVPFYKTGDYTHEDITEIGLLLAVAEYFETKPAPGKSTPPAGGSLTGLGNGITARKLYDNYFGTAVSEAKLQHAVDDIINYNVLVERDHFTEAKWHLNGEQIQQANQEMQALRDKVLQILTNSSTPNYDLARQAIGQYLHMIQDFYSNTNWVELKVSTIYEDLGITGKTLMPVALPTVNTCKSCGTHAVPPMPCFIASPLIATGMLTSGYKGGQDTVKPPSDPATNSEGKCSHGGINDNTSTTIAAVGGINKETSDGHYSDLFLDHTPAADAAIQHTKFFFNHASYGLRHLIGDDKFIELLHLQSGNSLIFVIDTSGTNERDSINQFIQSIVQNASTAGQSPYDYIMVTVDKSTNKSVVQKTKDSNQITTWLQGLTLPSSPVCPGSSVQGTEAAVSAAGYMSTVYVFTDTPPKDPASMNYIESLVSEKHLTLTYLVTGECSRRRKRNSTPLTAWEFKNGLLRRARSTSYLGRPFTGHADMTKQDEPFRAKLLEESKSGNFKFEISGSPHAGKAIVVLIRMNEILKIDSLDQILFIDEEGSEIMHSDARKINSRSQTHYNAEMIIPSQVFRIKVTGENLFGRPIELINRKKIVPVLI